MDAQKQEHLRSIAHGLLETNNAEIHALAEGTLELLNAIEELQDTLDETMIACCDAVALAYNYETFDPMDLLPLQGHGAPSAPAHLLPPSSQSAAA